MTPSDPDWVSAISAVVTVVVTVGGIAFQFYWANKQTKANNSLASAEVNIEAPVSKAIDMIDDFESSIRSYKRGSIGNDSVEIETRGIRLVRAINTGINRAAKLDNARQSEWDSISTEDLETLIESANDENRELSSKVILQELNRLRTKMEALRSEAMKFYRR